MLAASLLITALVAPVVSGAVARRAEGSIGPVRGELAEVALAMLRGAPEITAAGAAPRALAEAGVVDARLAAAERRSALGAGLGSLTTGLAGGAAVWLALVLGIAAVRDGSLAGVALAVVVLTPITVHEITAPLAAGARQLPRTERVRDPGRGHPAATGPGAGPRGAGARPGGRARVARRWAHAQVPDRVA